MSICFDKVLQLEIFSRVIDPSSKYNDFKNKDNFAENFNFSKDDIYDSLDILYKYKNDFIKAIKDNIKYLIKIKKDILHTDSSNIYVYTNEDKNNENTLIQYGYSKENKSLPIAQFMYITDTNGLPLNFKAYQGSKPDVSLYNDFINETRDIYNIKKSIVVADAGFVSNDNIVNTLINNMHYIFKESMLRLNKSIYNSFKTNILSMVEEIEKENSDFKGFCKSFNVEVPRKVKDIYGKIKTVNITQKYIFVYSKKQDERLTNLRVNELKKVDELINDKNKLEEIIKRISSSLTKIDNKDKIKIEVDENKLKKYTDTSGFSLLITDILDMDEKEIIRAYRNQYLVEDVFKNLKSSFSIRPVFLKKENRIKSHMLICFFALLFTKIIHLGLNKEYSITNIQKAIKYLRLSKVGDNNIWELKGESIIAKKITELLDIQIDKTVVNGNDIRNIVKNCKIKI
ncbi:IS1634 family transposase [Pseudostreptobacillus hongkongensis]